MAVFSQTPSFLGFFYLLYPPTTYLTRGYPLGRRSSDLRFAQVVVAPPTLYFLPVAPPCHHVLRIRPCPLPGCGRYNRGCRGLNPRHQHSQDAANRAARCHHGRG
jgi:hypothetical protein